MQRLYIYLISICLLLITAGCGISDLDNYDSPDAVLEGSIVYNDEPIPVSYDNVTFELWQSGFGRELPIEVTVDQDGSFATELFDGDYRLIIPEGQGPFQRIFNEETQSDSINVTLSGSDSLNIEVLPYYMIRNTQFSNSGRTVSANFSLEQIISPDDGGQNVERVSLYVSKTNFVDGRTSESTIDLAGGEIGNMNNISLSTDVPEFTPTQDYAFARVGVKIQNVEDMMFSAIEKIDF